MERISIAARRHLEQVLLPFWQSLRDMHYGGYYGYVGQDLTVDPRAEKGCILHSRILWFFSEAAMALERDDLRREAEHAYRFVHEKCIDRKNGGIFWSMRYDGAPLDTTKHTYNQAFAIYALSAYYRLTGDEAALADARTLFSLIEEKCTDEYGYLEAFTADWKPASNEKLSENGVMAEKTMNTLLHVFEGYSGLYRAAPTPALHRAMERVLDIYETKIWSQPLQRQLVFFDRTYRSLIDLYSYGHDIESSWLIDAGCALLHDPQRFARISRIDTEMAQAVFRAGYRDRSMAAECDRGTVDTRRIWWVQAETVLGLTNLYEKTGLRRYADAAADTFRFILEKLTDARPHSEWFWCVDESGAPLPELPIVEPWKCPYHNGRMCMELMRKDPDIYV